MRVLYLLYFNCRLPAPINKLTLLDTSGSTQEFYREAPLTNGSITVFPGPGELRHTLHGPNTIVYTCTCSQAL